MRTTLVIADAVMRRLKALAAQRGVTLASVVEDFLRRDLEQEARAVSRPRPSRRLPTFRMGAPKVDLSDRQAMEAAMEADRVRR
jgi:hypothetical protein